MSPESRGGFALVVAMCFQPCGEQVVCELACLLEAVDALGDFKVDPSVVDVGVEAVLVTELLWDVGKSDPDVFRAVEWRAQVEVLNVEAGKARIGA